VHKIKKIDLENGQLIRILAMPSIFL
jgi:hypothetical protein